MSLTDGPERYSAPPVETWMMPSDPASAKPFRAALRVCEEDTLIAGNANALPFAVSSISAYFSGVTIGIGLRSSGGRRISATDPSGYPLVVREAVRPSGGDRPS